MSMDALRLRYYALAMVTATAVCFSVAACDAATFQTRNFSITADRPEFAEEVGQRAEHLRRQLAIFWLGQPLPNWSKPCKLRVREGALGAGGQTTFQFTRGEVLNWDMFVQGSRERILDSVLPHEINHTIFACHFRRPLPRWADEGAATLFEHRSEQLKQLALLNDVIDSTRERFSLEKLMSMKEYPEGMRPMLILYAQGYALADFLVQQKGRRAYLQFLSDGEKIGWEEAIRKNFDHEGVQSLERNWRGWVLAGMPKLTAPREQMLTAMVEDNSAAGDTAALASPGRKIPGFRGRRIPRNAVLRSQSPETGRSDSPVSQADQDTSGPADPVPHDDSKASEINEPARQRGYSTIQAPAPVTLQSETETNDSDFTRQMSEGPVYSLARESTTASTKPADMDVSSDFQLHLPGERSVVSGSTPRWAGFPGHEKLF